VTRALRAVLILLATLFSMPASAQLKVIISGGFSGAYEQLVPEFERTSGTKIETGSGASQAAARRPSPRSSRAA